MSGLILPALALGALGWLVPRLLARIFPEGVRPLLALALCATLLMVVLSAAVFVLLYRIEGAPVAALFGPPAADVAGDLPGRGPRAGAWAGLWHFLRLGLLSALIWAPVLVLSVAGLPRHWVHETW